MLYHIEGSRIGSVPSVQNPGVVIDVAILFGDCLQDHEAGVEEDLGDD